jgi:hypothetical protein
MGAAFAVLAVAILPGALRLVPASRDLERADLEAADLAARPSLATLLDGTPPSTAPALAPTTGAAPPAPPVPAPAADEVAIVPPAQLTGTPAPMVAMSTPYAAASTAGPSGQVFALVVGIDDYPGSEYDLSSAVADADTVEAALTRFGVPAANQVVLRDGQARRDQLVAAVQALVSRAGPGTTVVFAYAGHVRKVDHDTEEMVTAEGATLTDRELAALLAPSRADHMWLLLATCYAGGFTELLAPGRVLTAAADADSLAYESRSLDGSYLVHHMIREGWLEGRAGSSVEEAFAYADARIAGRYPDRRPIQYDHVGGPLRLGTTGGEPSAPPGASPPPPPPSSPTTTEPERTCSLLVLCRRS